MRKLEITQKAKRASVTITRASQEMNLCSIKEEPKDKTQIQEEVMVLIKKGNLNQIMLEETKEVVEELVQKVVVDFN